MQIERIFSACRKAWQALVGELPEAASIASQISLAVDGVVGTVGKLASRASQPAQLPQLPAEGEASKATPPPAKD